MTKIAFVYSGQGAQYVGMGKELYESSETVQKVFNEANAALDMDIASICFEDNPLLNQTAYTQPAILTVSVAIDALLKEKNIEPEMVAGLSLGEYSALVKSGVLSFKEAVQLVRKRGQYMTEAVPAGEGAMLAIMGLDRQSVQEVCTASAPFGYVSPANYNMPGQIAIAGEKQAVEKAGEAALEKGAKRVVPLQVSGPFHTALLEPASVQLGAALQDIEMHSPKIPVVSNTVAEVFENKEQIKELLIKQVMSPVYWEDSVRLMIEMGVDTFIEVGPGRTLSSFIKKTDKSVSVYNVEDKKSLDKTLAKLYPGE